ncbi:hypothetical protein [Acrocarpospora catenulata]|uniref:hypothetical protein n=1 Tax=Acrocarpospora catenulata TaxID=2836182 RepID=UPI001BD9DE94|nr:hypothetical protein [Acrocarpospora catenulata]
MDITPMDEYMLHQTIEPVAHVSQNDPSWAERLFVGFHEPGNFALHTGLSLYPNNDTVEAYACFIDWRDLGKQHSLRMSTDLANGRHPLGAGSIRVDVLEPMKRFKMTSTDNDLGLAYELDVVARGEPHAAESVKRYRKGRLAYDNIVVFQPVTVSGTVEFNGHSFVAHDILGHRDRSWGIRTSGEGRIPRGLYLFAGGEFEDYSIMVFLQERFNGDIVRHTGAVTYADSGRTVEFVEITHELDIDADARALRSGRLTMLDAEGKSWIMDVQPEAILYMAGAGYTSMPDRRGKLGRPSWHATWDLNDRETVRKIDGLNDHLCSATLNGSIHGRAMVEPLYGEYTRYGLRAAEGATFDES